MKPSNRVDLIRAETPEQRRERHERMIEEMRALATRKIEDRIPTPFPPVSKKYQPTAALVERMRVEDSPVLQDRKSEDGVSEEEETPKKPAFGRRLTA